MLFRWVPKGGDTINEHFIPEDSKLGLNMFGFARDTKLWGEDARIFRPERWLTQTPEVTRRMETDIELVFGYGKWQCLGMKAAQMQLNKIFVQNWLLTSKAQLLRNFEITTVKPEQPAKLHESMIFILSDMWVKIEKRQTPL
ncbi:Cytochrome P450 monooxygenase mpaDE [Lachnellula suecica]|uniref:Cytochrome P450 monooxygenase mpaDE n=1 Tax=Lachnellula suecica TaxID=602035 RepID=A0A8T9BV60_9HELO|nr:Cytochrome P450 monooxygenase mpaDE [Lachnellula suecica]